MNVELASELRTQEFGQILWKSVTSGCVIFLLGELGAGKTTLVRGFLRAAGFNGAVKSPTFTLVEEYNIEKLHIFHFDLYRISDAEELEWMGFRDYFSDDVICFVEWPRRGEGLLPTADIELKLDIADDRRRLTVTAYTTCGKAIFSRLQAHNFPEVQ